MIWKEYLNKVAEELADCLSEDVQYSGLPKKHIRQIAWREIEQFVEHYKKWSPEKLILIENRPVSNRDKNRVKNFLKKREKGMPLAHIFGKQRFFGMDIKVNKNVLIPRPETEELVNYALKKIEKDSVIIDIGTGSGCILTAILKNLPGNIKLAEIYAIDKSKSALNIAKVNTKLNLGNKFKINYISSSLIPPGLSKKINKKTFFVANLPYLSEKEYSQLSPEVKKYEPKTALVGGKEGHELITKLIDQVLSSKIKFEMFLEISPTIYPKIIKHLSGKDVKYTPIKDLSGKIRFLHIMPSTHSRKY